ncbi:MAG TPA: CHASE3 domain-containing protein, partial [Polyangiaceae bacterium]|nr:CHASE3 domain-containing protein [Polyangiaceae bacterium]
MNWTFGKKLALGFAVAVLTVMVIGVSGYRSTAQLIENDRLVEHTHEVKRTLAQLLSSLKDVETGQRGFLLTGDETFLEPYYAGLKETEKMLADARRMTADNPLQQRRLVELGPAVEARLASLARRIEQYRSHGLEPIQKGGLLNEGKERMLQVRKLVAELDQTESQLLRERRQQSEQSASSAQATILWGSLMGGALVLGAALVITRSLSAQIGVAVRHVQTSA